MLGYRAGLLLDRLQAHPDVGEAKLVHLEWTYFQVLRHSQHPTLTLHRALSRDPELFVSFLKMIFLPAPDSGVTKEPPDCQTASNIDPHRRPKVTPFRMPFLTAWKR